jgi:ribonuclease Z
MRPNLHPRLVNGRFGDPALFVEQLHRREVILFDLGDLSALSARDLLRVETVCVSHMHMDHFIGFDALLRVNIGREKSIRMIGPPGLIDATDNKLHGYTWDLAHKYDADLVFDVWEVTGPAARFRFKAGFDREPLDAPFAIPGLSLSSAILEHHGPSIAYALSEPCHVNVWPNRLAARGLAPGQWLQALKAAVRDGEADETPIVTPAGAMPLGAVRDLVSVEPGQKLAYVTDVADTPANRARIAELAQGADLLFLEARFAAADGALARDRAHLTTRATGEIARTAGVRRLEPFHFSPRYEGQEAAMIAEVEAAFAGHEEGAAPRETAPLFTPG